MGDALDRQKLQNAQRQRARRANENFEAQLRRQNQVHRQNVLHRNELPQQAAVRCRNELLRLRFLNLALINVDDVLPERHSLGEFNNCEHCDALKFQNESFKCCSDGKVRLPPLLEFQKNCTNY